MLLIIASFFFIVIISPCDIIYCVLYYLNCVLVFLQVLDV